MRGPQGPGIVPLPSATFSEPDLVEDHSDVLNEDEDKLDKKVADLKVRRSRGGEQTYHFVYVILRRLAGAGVR